LQSIENDGGREGMNLSAKRSYLFVPSTSIKMMEKALESKADCVIFDLEDAVVANEKPAARERAQHFLLNHKPKKDVYMRINDITTPYWKEDLIAAINAGASGIVVPKADSSMKNICQTVLEHLEKGGRDIHSFEVLPLIETARGIQFVYEIANSHHLISRLAFGSIDYALDVDCQLSADGEELLFARSQIVNASKAAGVGSPIDAVYPNLGDLEGLRVEATRSRKLGFKAKLAIHPKQLDTIQVVFTPEQKEIEEALTIVKAFEEAEQRGLAYISVDAKLADYPVYKKAKALLQNISLQ
jgi:citrate lyase subunit beta / citryl-CoA lyase